MADQIVAMFKTEIEVFILFHITTTFFIINYFGILYRIHISRKLGTTEIQKENCTPNTLIL